MKIVDGNLLDSKADYIGHQVNTYGVMGGGIAQQIKAKYPKVFEEYIHFCNNKNKEELLGNVLPCELESGQILLNLFGQETQTDYFSLRKCFDVVAHHYGDKAIAMPYKIGCGLGGGDWNMVSEMLKEIFDGCDITLYRYDAS